LVGGYGAVAQVWPLSVLRRMCVPVPVPAPDGL
jgi:hypothetical protein